MLKDLASEDGEADPQNAKSILRGAREKLNDLEEKVQERLPDDTGTDGADGPGRRPKSEYSRQERAEQYQEWRDQGKDPNEEWEKLPD